MILVSPVDMILRYDSVGLRQERVQKGKDGGVRGGILQWGSEAETLVVV